MIIFAGLSILCPGPYILLVALSARHVQGRQKPRWCVYTWGALACLLSVLTIIGIAGLYRLSPETTVMARWTLATTVCLAQAGLFGSAEVCVDVLARALFRADIDPFRKLYQRGYAVRATLFAGGVVALWFWLLVLR